MSKGQTIVVGLWGGFGSRQGPLTRQTSDQKSRIPGKVYRNLNAVPKPLMPVATVPMSRIGLENIIDGVGKTEIYATTYNLHDSLAQYYLNGDGRSLGVRELWKEASPMGTAPGLVMNLMLRNRLRDATVVVPSGDIVTDLDVSEMIRMHREKGSLCTIALNPVPSKEVYRFGTAQLVNPENGLGIISAFKEKKPPSDALRSVIDDREVFLNNASYYIFEPSLLVRQLSDRTTILDRIFPNMNRQLREEILSGQINVSSAEEAQSYFARFGAHNPGFSDFGGHLFPLLAKEGLMRGYHFREYWNDLGDNETYWSANWHAMAGRFKAQIPIPYFGDGVWISPSAEIVDPNSLIPPVIIGDGVRIDSGAVVGPYAVVDKGWTIGRNAQVSFSVIWPDFSLDGYTGARVKEIQPGTVVQHSIIGGRLSPGDTHFFSTLVTDSRSLVGSELTRAVTGLSLPFEVEISVAKQTKKILVVEDNEEFLGALLAKLGIDGWEIVDVAKDIKEAEEKLRGRKYDVVVLDSILSSEEKEESEGVTILKGQKLNPQATNYSTPVVFWTSKDSEDALKGLSISQAFAASEGAVYWKKKEDEDVKMGNISQYLLKVLKVIA